MVSLTVSLLARHFPIGGSFSFDVLIDGPDEVNAAIVNMVYDANILEFIRADYILSRFPSELVSDSSPGIIRMSRLIPKVSVSGRNIFATLHFQGIAPGDGKVDFSPDCEVAGFVSETDVLQSKIGAVFMIDDIDTNAPQSPQQLEAQMAVKQIGSKLEISFKEATLNEDGTPLTDLSKTSFEVANTSDLLTPIATVEVPASTPTGGADQVATVDVPVVGGSVQDLTITGKSVDLIGNASKTPKAIQLTIDTLAPSAPDF